VRAQANTLATGGTTTSTGIFRRSSSTSAPPPIPPPSPSAHVANPQRKPAVLHVALYAITVSCVDFSPNPLGCAFGISARRGSRGAALSSGCASRPSRDYKVVRDNWEFDMNVCADTVRVPPACKHQFGDKVERAPGYQTLCAPHPATPRTRPRRAAPRRTIAAAMVRRLIPSLRAGYLQ